MQTNATQKLVGVLWTFSTRLYHATEVGNVSHRAGEYTNITQ